MGSKTEDQLGRIESTGEGNTGVAWHALSVEEVFEKLQSGAPVSLAEWAILILIAFVLLLVMELFKVAKARTFAA